MDFEVWKRHGRYVTVAGRQIFVVDTGGDGIPVVILHGYPTSGYDYHRAIPLLGAERRVVVHDHLGFGLSDKPSGSFYSLFDQADLARAVWRELDIDQAHVVAHDYGTSIATELLARRPEGRFDFRMVDLTLCNGSMHIEMAKLRPIQQLLKTPGVGELVARMSTERVFQDNIRSVMADPMALTDGDLDTMWKLLQYNKGRRVLPRISRYVDERRRHWDRWIGALRSSDLPVHVAWGTEDPVAVVAMAHQLNREIPDASLSLLTGLGHFPMLEDPDRWAAAVVRGLTQRPGG